jgi:hypothetical protein
VSRLPEFTVSLLDVIAAVAVVVGMSMLAYKLGHERATRHEALAPITVDTDGALTVTVADGDYSGLSWNDGSVTALGPDAKVVTLCGYEDANGDMQMITEEMLRLPARGAQITPAHDNPPYIAAALYDKDGTKLEPHTDELVTR